MNLDSIPLFSLLRGRLGYVNQRQQLIAQNVANADTPGYTARDLKPFTIAENNNKAGGQMRIAATAGAHIAPTRQTSSNFAPVDTPDSETTLDGNRVVLEEQMIKMSEARMDYDAAIGFYQKSLNIIRLAARRPG